MSNVEIPIDLHLHVFNKRSMTIQCLQIATLPLSLPLECQKGVRAMLDDFLLGSTAS